LPEGVAVDANQMMAAVEGAVLGAIKNFPHNL
jgi:hypothetical protein